MVRRQRRLERSRRTDSDRPTETKKRAHSGLSLLTTQNLAGKNSSQRSHTIAGVGVGVRGRGRSTKCGREGAGGQAQHAAHQTDAAELRRAGDAALRLLALLHEGRTRGGARKGGGARRSFTVEAPPQPLPGWPQDPTGPAWPRPATRHRLT
ncbi:hypothetical protein E2C01_042333 [Portunus trituberculatus]|uniref:Uncharacterized protein n=1 Tax=Portunus trituberculatus TaxID=210409 RepID=A0A5B7FT65_PORTR|nr:hypothetical protein [Portunus trituberculatus]